MKIYIDTNSIEENLKIEYTEEEQEKCSEAMESVVFACASIITRFITDGFSSEENAKVANDVILKQIGRFMEAAFDESVISDSIERHREEETSNEETEIYEIMEKEYNDWLEIYDYDEDELIKEFSDSEPMHLNWRIEDDMVVIFLENDCAEITIDILFEKDDASREEIETTCMRAYIVAYAVSDILFGSENNLVKDSKEIYKTMADEILEALALK